MTAVANSAYSAQPYSPTLAQLQAQGVESRFVDVAGIATHYLSAGLDKPGPPVVLVHGMAMSCEYWVRNIPTLAERYPTYALSFWGFGFSATKPGLRHTLSNYVAFLRRFMVELGLERVALVGHSMGGHIAARFASVFPDMVARLVLADAAGLRRDESLLRIAYNIFRDADMQDPQYRQMAYRIAAQSRNFRRERDSAVMVLRDLLDSTMLRQIVAPTLVVWGERDGFVPLRYGEALAQAIPAAHLEVIPGGSHTVMYHCAAEWNALVLDFLAAGASASGL